MWYLLIVYFLCTLDAVPEELQEPETTVVEPEADEPNLDHHYNEDLDNGKSTDARLMHIFLCFANTTLGLISTLKLACFAC